MALDSQTPPADQGWSPEFPSPPSVSLPPALRPLTRVTSGSSLRPRPRYFDPETGQEEDKVLASDFETLTLLGKGDVGRVFLVRHRATGRLHAMKVMKKADIIKRKKVHRLITEWELLTQHDHPMIAKLHYSFQSRTMLYFVLEYCPGGEFFRFLKSQKNCRLPEHVARFYAAEVLLALEFLHLNGFVYRDIKPENILMDTDGHVLLTDFDLSKKTLEDPRITLQHREKSGMVGTPPTKQDFSSFVGTVEYIAPEILRDAGHSHAVDWWGFGILIYEMVYGMTPFRGTDQSETFVNIASKGVTFPNSPVVSDAFKSIVRVLLHTSPQSRLGAKHGAAEVKSHRWFKDINFCLIRNQEPPLQPNILDTSDIEPYTGESPLSDGEPDDTFAEAPERVSTSTKAVGGPSSPYTHRALARKRDPFEPFQYYCSKGYAGGTRRYQKCASPVSPPASRCTGFGSGGSFCLDPATEVVSLADRSSSESHSSPRRQEGSGDTDGRKEVPTTQYCTGEEGTTTCVSLCQSPDDNTLSVQLSHSNLATRRRHNSDSIAIEGNHSKSWTRRKLEEDSSLVCTSPSTGISRTQSFLQALGSRLGSRK